MPTEAPAVIAAELPAPNVPSAPPSETSAQTVSTPPDPTARPELAAASVPAELSPPGPNRAIAAEAEHPQSAFPAGIAIRAELSRSLQGKKCKVGDPVEATTLSEVPLPGHSALRAGTKILAHVSNLKASAKASRNALIEIIFDYVLTPEGQKLPLRANLQAIGRPVSKLASMDNSMFQSSASPPASGPAPSTGASHSAAPPPAEPAQVSNPDRDTATPGGEDPQALKSDSRGVIGLPGLALSISPQASIISSEKGDVHLDKETQLIVVTQQ
jgi:hypothetical protein